MTDIVEKVARAMCRFSWRLMSEDEQAEYRRKARAAIEAISMNEIIQMLQRCLDREYNAFEPDNQSRLYTDLKVLVAKLEESR